MTDAPRLTLDEALAEVERFRSYLLDMTARRDAIREEAQRLQAKNVQLKAEVDARRASEALLAASLKKADAEVERLEKLLRLASDGDAQKMGWITGLEAERDRLRAVLAATPENMLEIRRALIQRCNWNDGLILAILADLRARAGVP